MLLNINSLENNNKLDVKKIKLMYVIDLFDHVG
jgi:hypothetical protein